MYNFWTVVLSLGLAVTVLLLLGAIHLVFIGPSSNPLRELPGPPSSLFDNTHMVLTMEYVF